jgi:hypothetical protein
MSGKYEFFYNIQFENMRKSFRRLLKNEKKRDVAEICNDIDRILAGIQLQIHLSVFG